MLQTQAWFALVLYAHFYVYVHTPTPILMHQCHCSISISLTTSLPHHISPFPLSLATTVLPVSPAGPPLHSLHRQPSLLSIEPRPLSWSQIGPVHYQEPPETCVLLPRHHGAHEACRCLLETVSSHGSPGTTLSQGAAAGIQLWLQTSGIFAAEDSQDSGESTGIVRFWYDSHSANKQKLLDLRMDMHLHMY